MNTLTQEQQTNIFNFLNGLNTEVCITDYVNIENIDFENPYNSIFETIQENSGFDIEIIYYSNAITYLQKNDPSLRESLEIASELGYTIKNINSELLASLLASQNAINDFLDLENEIENFFSELLTELNQQ
jgi:hypothetical protein